MTPCRWFLLWVVCVVAWLTASTVAAPPRFLSDDPIAVDDEAHDARAVRPRTAASGLGAEIAQQLAVFVKRQSERARNLNTIDEVPDSSWFNNRSLDRPVSPAAASGPAAGGGDRLHSTWTVVAGDARGTLPRLTVLDATGRRHEMTFDLSPYPELATGATMVAARLLADAGYHVPEHWLEHVGRERLSIAPGATIADALGRRRRMTRSDLELLLERAARRQDGRYRAVVRRAPDGVDLGPFAYAGTRVDDPNDHIPHEHRRELRGLRVFAAWLNHDAASAFGTQDVLIDEAGRRRVRHFLADVGWTLGSGTTLAPRTFAANEYAWRARPKLRTMLTLGFAVQPWDKVEYPASPSVGLFESTIFDPSTWVPAYNNPAFANARSDDLFWAARRVASIGDDAIRSAVAAGEYSDPVARDYLSHTLMVRRAKVAAAWLNVVLPLIDCHLSVDGWLSCATLAGDDDAAAGRFAIRWYQFDNATDQVAFVAEGQTVAGLPRFAVPPALLAIQGIIVAEIHGSHPVHAGWETPMKAFFRRMSDGWQLVGLERAP